MDKIAYSLPELTKLFPHLADLSKANQTERDAKFQEAAEALCKDSLEALIEKSRIDPVPDPSIPACEDQGECPDEQKCKKICSEFLRATDLGVPAKTTFTSLVKPLYLKERGNRQKVSSRPTGYVCDLSSSEDSEAVMMSLCACPADSSPAVDALKCAEMRKKLLKP